MEDNKKPQVSDIIKIIDDNYNEYKGNNEAVLHAAEDIIELFKQVQEVPPVPDKMPSAEEYLSPFLNSKKDFNLLEVMESFASLAIDNERQKWEELEQQNITLLRENEEFRSQIRKMRLENPLKPFLKDKNHPLSCKKCGDYFGINIDHKCFKCLEPLF